MRNNVVICGLTAAGKTTHAKLLARDLNYEYVSGTATLARMCGVEVHRDPPRWSEIASAVSRKRHDGIDERLEQELLRLSEEREGQVFDVWALPWTSTNPNLIRIWIESNRLSRQAKCFVSQGARPTHDLNACGKLIDDKDSANRELFARTIGFDLFTDHDVFDFKLENTSFINAPTRKAANAGVAAFAPLIATAVSVGMGKMKSVSLRCLAERYSLLYSARSAESP